ncbi:MAG: SIR2 family protein [Lachnospiraceae bacterium]|nr:SIR2 family protein [Lachnospiraceae bacterium]
MTIEDIIDKFNTTPFLFIGSGISRRYLNLPDWKGLLKHFAECISDDEFIYDSYENKAKTMNCKSGLMPKVAELIQRDFDEKWFADGNIRTIDREQAEKIHQGLSPFKAELAEYLKKWTIINTDYREEIDKLAKISEKNIAGVITTNYDSFLEDSFKGFTKYVGQSQLIFSAIQGIAEIYKIHGSVERPESIVINVEDYELFERNSTYLAAKLMTIFMENPIIFMGYSISDSNIQGIIKSIVNCLDTKQVNTLGERFIFVEYQPEITGAEVTPYTLMIENKPLTMKKIALNDFMLLYNALENKKAKLPVSILRRFKKELYEYTITNTPTAHLRVASIDDTRVKDDDLVLAIGKASTFGLKGLSGLDANEWYRNIVLEDLEFSADELLEHAFPKLIKQNSGKLPLNKYLSEAVKDFSECREIALKQDFDGIISKTIKNNRRYLGDYKSVKQIWEQEKTSRERALRLIAHLQEKEIAIDELENVLKEIFETDVNVLQNAETNERSAIRRLIRIYDYLKWGK